MCVVSMIGDHFDDRFKKEVPSYPYAPILTAEISLLRKQMEELKELLKKAFEYDRRTDQPHCENEDKYERIKRFAKELGVDLEWEDE